MKVFVCVFSWVAFVLGLNVLEASPGIGTRGGGNVLVCFPEGYIEKAGLRPVDESGRLVNVFLSDDDIRAAVSLTTFDHYEAQLQLRGGRSVRSIIEAFEDEGPEAYVERILTPFESVFPQMVSQLRRNQESLSLSSAFYYPHGVKPQQDFSAVGLLSPNCVLSTLFVQELLGNRRLLHVDDRLWSTDFAEARLSATDRGVAYLHELVYMDFRSWGSRKSDKAREMVRLLITRNPDLSFADFQKSLNALGAKYQINSYSRFLGIDAIIQNSLIDLFREHYNHEVAEAIDLVENFLRANDLYVRPRNRSRTDRELSSDDFLSLARNPSHEKRRSVWSDDPLWCLGWFSGSALDSPEPLLRVLLMTIEDESPCVQLLVKGSTGNRHRIVWQSLSAEIDEHRKEILESAGAYKVLGRAWTSFLEHLPEHIEMVARSDARIDWRPEDESHDFLDWYIDQIIADLPRDIPYSEFDPHLSHGLFIMAFTVGLHTRRARIRVRVESVESGGRRTDGFRDLLNWRPPLQSYVDELLSRKVFPASEDTLGP